MGVCNLCYAFRDGPGHDAAFLNLLFQKPRLRSFLKANDRLSAISNTNLLNLLLVYRVASNSSICKTIIIIIIIDTVLKVCTSVLSLSVAYTYI